MPLPNERVMLFVRASVPGAEKAKPADSVVKQVGLLAEWIELDQTTLSSLLDANPIANNADAMRAALETHLTDGSAKLMESAFVQCRGGQLCKVESGREYAYPTEFVPPQIPEKPSGLPPPPFAGVFPSNPLRHQRSVPGAGGRSAHRCQTASPARAEARAFCQGDTVRKGRHVEGTSCPPVRSSVSAVFRALPLPPPVIHSDP